LVDDSQTLADHAQRPDKASFRLRFALLGLRGGPGSALGTFQPVRRRRDCARHAKQQAWSSSTMKAISEARAGKVLMVKRWLRRK
jgi:hypothetical protein